MIASYYHHITQDGGDLGRALLGVPSAQGSSQRGCGNLQGQRCLDLSGQPVPVLNYAQRKEFSLNPFRKLPVSVCFFSVRFPKEPGSVFLPMCWRAALHPAASIVA